MHISSDIGIWIAALGTIAIFSFLYRENPVFRFAEHLLVGVSAGYYLVQYAHSGLIKKFWYPLTAGGNYWLVFGALLGAMMFLKLNRKTRGWGNIPVAFYVATGAGYLIPSVMKSMVLLQVGGTIRNPFAAGNSAGDAITTIVIFVGVICTLVYFYFSARRTGVVKHVSRVGMLFLLAGFGATFGYTVMGRITLLIGRFQFLLRDWLGVGI
ncbi:MAG: hypothetical protein KAW17_00500 [Candidatus Eisenbacteria sp.]|nr:hypothetical protein [Candidatus Eisenbacteria bacterium]